MTWNCMLGIVCRSLMIQMKSGGREKAVIRWASSQRTSCSGFAQVSVCGGSPTAAMETERWVT
ncbi:hypothetical protein AAFF_G00379870 [Aldrovandia affinis]|uniref:Uncharacterized protein n=1 Tax=Aldrovandia affinis TaxID=143900 RepID=A0AAD7R473_9TELE|nr:hypothetical protein AAFF_G00379870 [Aldrovandia affinis]